MGKKVNPIIHRLGTVFNWTSRWFSDKASYKQTLLADVKLRSALLEKLRTAGIGRVEIERSINNIKVIVFVSRPGMVIGRSGTGLEELKKFVVEILTKAHLEARDFYLKTAVIKQKYSPKVELRVEAIKDPNIDAYLVAKNVADQLVKRLPFKRILNQNAERAMQAGAKGIKILLSGRIAGAEIGRREKIHVGTVPLSTIRAKILYASEAALTKKGYIGVKVWINLGEK